MQAESSIFGRIGFPQAQQASACYALFFSITQIFNKQLNEYPKEKQYVENREG
jgi:hypothetical protein